MLVSEPLRPPPAGVCECRVSRASCVCAPAAAGAASNRPSRTAAAATASQGAGQVRLWVTKQGKPCTLLGSMACGLDVCVCLGGGGELRLQLCTAASYTVRSRAPVCDVNIVVICWCLLCVCLSCAGSRPPRMVCWWQQMWRHVDWTSQECRCAESSAQLGTSRRQPQARCFLNASRMLLYFALLLSCACCRNQPQMVVHYQLPASADTYIHRSGRTARTGSNDGVSLVRHALLT